MIDDGDGDGGGDGDVDVDVDGGGDGGRRHGLEEWRGPSSKNIVPH